MVWLDVTNTDGNSLYLDIHACERRDGEKPGFQVVSATLGDGCYEGEVVIELKDGVELTFADHFFAPRDLAAFCRRVDLEHLKSVLAAKLAENPAAPRPVLPHVARHLCAEEIGGWQLA